MTPQDWATLRRWCRREAEYAHLGLTSDTAIRAYQYAMTRTLAQMTRILYRDKSAQRRKKAA